MVAGQKMAMKKLIRPYGFTRSGTADSHLVQCFLIKCVCYCMESILLQINESGRLQIRKGCTRPYVSLLLFVCFTSTNIKIQCPLEHESLFSQLLDYAGFMVCKQKSESFFVCTLLFQNTGVQSKLVFDFAVTLLRANAAKHGQTQTCHDPIPIQKDVFQVRRHSTNIYRIPRPGFPDLFRLAPALCTPHPEQHCF